MAVWREINSIDARDLSFALENGLLLGLFLETTAKRKLDASAAFRL